MAENLTPKKYIDGSNMKQILAAIKDKTPVGDKYITEEQLLAKDYATKTYVGEQIAEKVDKTDIATTIDGTSTDTQVASAKAVYDKYSLHDLSEASTNVLDNALMVDTQNQNSAVNKDCLVTSSSIQIPNDLLWGIRQVFWHANSDLVLKITGKDINNKSCIWINSLSLKDGEHYWQGWLKNATTSVADVDKTAITITDTTNYKNKDSDASFSHYYVQNGICYMSMWIACVTPYTSSATKTCTSTVPKPKYYVRKIVPAWETTNSNSNYIEFCINGTSAFIAGGTTGKTYLLQFSYPVAES